MYDSTMSIRAAAILAGLVGASLASAQTWPRFRWAPKFHQITKSDGVSFLSMECEGEGPMYRRIRCTFNQVMITRPTSERTRERIRSMFEAMNELSDRQLARELQRGCREAPDIPACACLSPQFDRGCIERSMAESVQRDSERCQVTMLSFEQTLQRTGPYRWRASLEGTPFMMEGCDEVTTLIVIEGQRPDDGGEAMLWTFRQSRAVVGSEECRRVYQQNSEFSWRHTPGELQCNGFSL